MTSKRAALYLRVSTDKQTVENQRQALEGVARHRGWQIVAAYGNASTDISAYANAGIPKTQTFIVGPLAGSDSTQPIDNMDYAQHIQTYVDAQPNNN